MAQVWTRPGLSWKPLFATRFLSSLSDQALEDLFVVVNRRAVRAFMAATEARLAKNFNSPAHDISCGLHNQWSQVSAELHSRRRSWPAEVHESMRVYKA
jgi:hypothetical protein